VVIEFNNHWLLNAKPNVNVKVNVNGNETVNKNANEQCKRKG